MRLMVNIRSIEAAIEALDAGNYFSITDLTEGLLVNWDTPESVYSEKELAEKRIALFAELSSEAKDVVKIIIDCPGDLVEFVCHNNNQARVSARKIASYLRKQWRNTGFVRELMEEVATFTVKLEVLSAD